MMKRYNIVLLLLLAIFSSCTKDKSDNKLPLADVSNKSNSSIRMFNFTNLPTDVTINNLPLTGYASAQYPTGQSTQLGLSLFPTGAWTSDDGGSPFTVPNSMLDKNGSIRVQIKNSYASSVPISRAFKVDTTIANDILHPRDYYLMGDGSIRSLDRDNVPPSNGQQFKIRVINLGQPNDYFNLNGPVSLTYSDGTHVAPELDNVAQGTASPYITLDYASLLFRVYGSNGANIDITKQYAETPEFPNYNPCLSSQPAQEAIMNKVRTFKPGGVYSVVITPTLYRLLSCDKFSNLYIIGNAYRIVTEQDPGVNYTYARMQAVNAVPDKQLTIQVDGQPLGGSTLDYIGNSPSGAAVRLPSSIFIQGSHTVQVLDGSTVLVKKNITLSPYDYYTIWAYPTADNKVDIAFAANDMTGTYKQGVVGSDIDDGTNGSYHVLKIPYMLRIRFLNLSPDLPFATFQNDQNSFSMPYVDSSRPVSAFTNLPSGVVPVTNMGYLYSMGPYSAFGSGASVNPVTSTLTPSLVRVYESVPGNIALYPGKLLTNIDPLDGRKGLVANPALYDAAWLPYAECGVYSIALVGYTKGGGTKARIVIIKHNN